MGRLQTLKNTKTDPDTRHANRRVRLLKQIKGEAALFCAPAPNVISRDQNYPFRQDSDLFYLTGFTESHSALLLIGTGKGPRSILYLRDRSEQDERWHGERLGVKRAKRMFKVDEVREYSLLFADLPKLLTETPVLHHTLGTNPEVDNAVVRLFQTRVGPQIGVPHTLKDARLLTAEMRFVKDRDEIMAIRHVVDITARGMVLLAQHMGEISSEAHGAALLESYFSKLGASGPAFDTIIAAGKNATVLHHAPKHQPLWKRELVLIDAGARFRGYAGDISRTLPVSGRFTWQQADLYDIVHRALEAAIRKARPGSSLEAIHHAAVSEITQGLIDLRVLKGPRELLIEQERYKHYYMHRTGHWLGLDVHDISPLSVEKSSLPSPSHHRALVPGNVFTIEPGIYIDARDEKAPRKLRGIGIRLEEDVLITENGCEVLSSGFPVKRADVEAMMG